MKRNIKDILSSMVTVKANATGVVNGRYVQTDVRLIECLVRLPEMRKVDIDTLRSLEYHSDAQGVLKSSLPIFYAGGTFPTQNIKDHTVITPSNLIILDIDAKDNPAKTLKEIKDILFSFDWVAGVYDSVSGKGCFAIVPVKDHKKTKSYYKYIELMLNKLYGIVIDKQACNIARGRFISYSEDWSAYTKRCDVSVWELEAIETASSAPSTKYVASPRRVTGYREEFNFSDLTRTAIWKLLNDGWTVESYGSWYYSGCDFANFEDGREMFEVLCENYGKQNDSPDAKWEECLQNPTPIEQVNRKYLGMCKNKYGVKWWR